MSKNRKRDRAARSRAGQTGETRQQAVTALQAAHLAAPDRPAAVVLDVDAEELVRLVLADQEAAGNPFIEEKARERVAFTVGLFRRYFTGADMPPADADRTVQGPHCSHDECSWGTCDHSGYAESMCRTVGCTICGGAPIATPEHWSGSVVGLALMSSDHRARAEAYQRSYPLLRRPGDPALIPEHRTYGPDDEECLECGASVTPGYSCTCGDECSECGAIGGGHVYECSCR